MINAQNLIKYYRECIEIESLEAFSSPSFKQDQQFTFLNNGKELSKKDDLTINQPIPTGITSYMQISGGSSLFYGWPIYTTPSVARNGNPFTWIEPIFLLRTEAIPGTNRQLRIIKEWPIFNDNVLKKFVDSVEERIHVYEMLGFTDSDSFPSEGLVNYWERFSKIYNVTDIIEPIDPENLVTKNNIDFQKNGFLNRAILQVSSIPKYSKKLLFELKELSQDNIIGNITDTALEALINPAEGKQETNISLSQITRLNNSQRRAIKSSYSNKISVITGPPGTGKSQVVLNILSNAFENNKSVLFTSKNNKAVDVVCERVLNKVKYPINLRLGPKTDDKDYTTEFLDLLDTALSGGNKYTIYSEYEREKRNYEQIKSEYYKTNLILENIVNLRNSIDTLDREIELLNKLTGFFNKINILRILRNLLNNFKISYKRNKLNRININELSKIIEDLEEIFINTSIKYLEALGRKRIIDLTQQDRNIVNNYYSVIRQLYSNPYPGDNTYSKLKEQEEKLFKQIIKILPVWSITNLSAGNHFPLCPNLFDQVVIDESSQSDIASAIPLLYRAKSTCIIGDPHQLKHISKINKKHNNFLMNKHHLIDIDSLRFSYNENSLFHCSRSAVDERNVTLLNEHYRSHFSIIEFSNKEWYDHSLEIRTNYDNLISPPDDRDHLEWINIIGKTERKNNRSALNKIEADEIINILDNIVSKYNTKIPSIGIVTPFAAQADYFHEKLLDKYDENFIKKYFIIADTAHKFQGDERDIILFSPVISGDLDNNSTIISFLRKTYNLFNVSITRARSILWVIGDKQKCISSGIKFLKDFIEYTEYKKYNNIDLPYNGFQSPWEKKFFEVLVSNGLDPKSQFPAGPYFIDIALLNENKKIAIEVDGEAWHTNLSGERLERDINRDRNLTKMGWEVIRFWVHDLKYDLNFCLKQVLSKI